MPYVPTFATRYLEDCLEQGLDPRSSLGIWIQQQSQSSTINESHATTPTDNTPSTQRRTLFSTPNSPSSSNQYSDFCSPNSTPHNLSSTRFDAFKDNIELSFPKRLGPFIMQTSTIFQEVIGGCATGEDELEEEQGDRRVHGFVYTRQGKRRTVFIAAAPIPASLSTRTHSALSTVPLLLPLQLPLGTPPSVRTFRTSRIRGQKNTTSPAETLCKVCTAYARFRSVELLLAAVPDMPLMCGLCEFGEGRARARRLLSQSQSLLGTAQTPTPTPTPAPTPMPRPSPRIRLIVKKRPLEAEAGNDQMTLQMMVDVQRNPKRVRKVPARFLES